MKVQLQPELEKRQPLAEIVRAAIPVLEQAIGSKAARMTATWDFRPDEHGRPLLHLTITDKFRQASTAFAPEELQPPEEAKSRFRRLWGDLLQEASERLSQKLEAMLAGDQGAP